MSAVGSAIAELEAKRAQIDDAIAVLRAVDGGGSPVVLRSIVTAGTVNGRTKKKWAQATPETWAKARQLFEAGQRAETIAAQLGVTTAALYWQRKHKGWKWPKVAVVGKVAGEQMPGKVRCPSCELWTERDPCSNCGKKVRR